MTDRPGVFVPRIPLNLRLEVPDPCPSCKAPLPEGAEPTFTALPDGEFHVLCPVCKAEYPSVRLTDTRPNRA